MIPVIQLWELDIQKVIKFKKEIIMSNIKSKVRVKFTVGNDSFIVVFGNEDVY